MLDGCAEHDGLAVLPKLHPLRHHIANDFHAARFGGAVRPFATRCCGAGHVGTLATEHTHGHQHARLREVVHGGGVDQVREQLSQAGGERRSRQANASGLGGLDELRPHLQLCVGFVDDDHVRLRPVATLRQCLRAGDLVRHFGVAAPVVRLHDAVRSQAIGVCRLAGLIDQCRAVAQKRHLAALHQRLMRDTVAQVGLTGTSGRHDQLVLMAFTEPLTQSLMGRLLERARLRKGRACIIGRIVKQA